MGRIVRQEIDEETRLLMFPRELDRERGSVSRPSITKDDRPVRVSNIPFGSNWILRGVSLLELVGHGDRPVLCFAALRAPAAVGDLKQDGGVKPAAIRARLAAGDDVLDAHLG